MEVKKLIFFFLFIPLFCTGQNKDLDIQKVADGVYVYTAWADMGKWGRIGSNGMVVADDGKALLCDTPVDEKQTKELLSLLKDSLGLEVISFIPNHWHDDCVGGLDYLNKLGVETYAYQLTNDILKSKSLPVTKHSFTDSLNLRVGRKTIKCHFLGGGHAVDNIVIWLPDQKILFGGCMVKDYTATGLGNTVDAAPLPEWLSTIQTVEKKFQEARIVIPGHGKYGDMKLLRYTEELLKQHIR